MRTSHREAGFRWLLRSILSPSPTGYHQWCEHVTWSQGPGFEASLHHPLAVCLLGFSKHGVFICNVLAHIGLLRILDRKRHVMCSARGLLCPRRVSSGPIRTHSSLRSHVGRFPLSLLPKSRCPPWPVAAESLAADSVPDAGSEVSKYLVANY